MQFLTKRTLLPVLALGVVATSCQDEDFGFTKQDVFNSAYSRTVQNLFGNVAPDQSWDFSSSATTRAVAEYESVCTESGTGFYADLYPNLKFYTIETSTVNWFRENLAEGQYHEGESFSFKIRENEQFEILPVYVGWSVLCTELHMVIDQGNGSDPDDVILFKKNPIHEAGDPTEVSFDGPTIIQRRDYCHDCKGTGYQNNNCPDCKGFGYVGANDGDTKCWLCNGTGNSVCLECAGDGRTTLAGDTNCPYCHRSKIRTCTLCGGLKKVKDCSSCEPKKCDKLWSSMNTIAKCNGGHIELFEEYGGGDFWYNVTNPWHVLYDFTNKYTTTPVGHASGDNWSVRGSNFSHSMDAYGELRATSYIVDANKMNLPEGTEIWFYLKVTNGDNKTPTGTELTSHSDRMMLVDMPTPDNIKGNHSDYTCKIIGIDDSFNSDSDHNDILFMVVGHVPDVIYYEGYKEETIKKRYLCEDLGSAFDLDFNDIVVDVTQTSKQHYKLNSETNEYTWDPAVISQEATVKHLCGTLPIQVKVGDYEFGRVTDPTDTELTKKQLAKDETALASTKVAEQGKPNTANNCPDVTAEITGWNPAKNNVTVKVWMNGLDGTSEDDVWVAKFPEAGSKTPYIIAVDQDFQWMPEGVLLTPEALQKGGDFSTNE